MEGELRNKECDLPKVTHSSSILASHILILLPGKKYKEMMIGEVILSSLMLQQTKCNDEKKKGQGRKLTQPSTANLLLNSWWHFEIAVITNICRYSTADGFVSCGKSLPKSDENTSTVGRPFCFPISDPEAESTACQDGNCCHGFKLSTF